MACSLVCQVDAHWNPTVIVSTLLLLQYQMGNFYWNSFIRNEILFCKNKSLHVAVESARKCATFFFFFYTVDLMTCIVLLNLLLLFMFLASPIPC